MSTPPNLAESPAPPIPDSVLEPILGDLGLSTSDLRGDLKANLKDRSENACQVAHAADVDSAGGEVGQRGLLLLFSPGSPSAPDLADLRNRAWPRFHAVAVYRVSGGRIERTSLSGAEDLGTCAGEDGAFLALRRREHVLSKDATVEKFDSNASGWNGEPGGPGYPHFRWMRRLVGRYTGGVQATRILDFGCGAGWVGIEAAQLSPGAHLSFFDPSPEMVRIAEGNARESGIADFTGRVGFGEEPPFPAEGEEPYDLVISSGVVSFSPDFEGWMRGLVSTCAAGGTLVVGDLHPTSVGMRQRKRTKPLLPVREMNGTPRGPVREWLEQRGFTHERSDGYQLSRPIPQAMHFNETRLKGVLSWPLVGANALARRMSSALGEDRFDSWVMRFRVPKDHRGVV